MPEMFCVQLRLIRLLWTLVRSRYVGILPFYVQKVKYLLNDYIDVDEPLLLLSEAQDDGVVAKIIVAAGGGEIPCGT